MVPTTKTFSDIPACVDATIARVGKRIVLGLPVGIGKPNFLVNEFVRRAAADPAIHLTIFTALSLRVPHGRSGLERRFLDPFVKRIFGDYPELEYVHMLERGSLPSNIEINEFFLEPGGWLRNDHLQQNYLSANYTHVARDLIRRGVNVIAQLVAPPAKDGTVSFSCNPDLAVDLLPHVESQRSAGKPFALIAQIHPDLPYMYGDAAVPSSTFDFIVDSDKRFPLFCPPNMPIGTTDYMIATNVSALVRDGGTLQLGIGELGDAIVYGLKLRHENPSDFAKLLGECGTAERQADLIAHEGGLGPFKRGLYGCTEMLVDGFVDLYRAGILKRRVYPHAVLQTLIDRQSIFETPNAEMLRALADAGLSQLSERDFKELQSAGVFAAAARFESGKIAIADQSIIADLSSADCRTQIAALCLGTSLREGVLVHAGFFFGPKAFYAALKELPEDERRQFAMQRISFVNELYGEDQALKLAQRKAARFVNTTMMVTGLGAAVSDGLADGRVVSGVGGQYNFVAMAHALPDARSILCLRSTRTTQARTSSNIVWNYGHVTIPRHLRDIVVTEYGIADLRGRTDSEVVAALVEVMDARFQDAFVATAKRNGKLAKDYRVPDRARTNTPQRLETILKSYRSRGLFAELPFGGEFTEDELVIAKALKRLQSITATRGGRMKAVTHALLSPVSATTDRYLERLDLNRPKSMTDRIERRLVAASLSAVIKAN